MHDHGGLYSFVIWMKIPYNYEEERKLPFLDGVKEPDKKPGNFEFSYPGMLGEIRTTRSSPICAELILVSTSSHFSPRLV